MSVSEDLLCAFELLKPLDGPALRKELAKSRRRHLCANFSLLSPSIRGAVSQAFRTLLTRICHVIRALLPANSQQGQNG
jgi:hypothetical protein